ncbi:MAG: hypothetical protein QME49_02600 [bacterium]|nr:hypothetical protein [bacterium]
MMIKICTKIILIGIISMVLILYGLSLGRDNYAMAMLYEITKILGLGSGSSLPVCPDSKGMEMPEINFCNLKVKGEAYQTRSVPSSLLKYYSQYLTKRGDKVYQKMITPEFGFAVTSNMSNKIETVMVCRNPEKQQTLVLPFKTEGDLIEWVKKIGSGKDVPGNDIKGVDRYPGSVRQFSMGQGAFNMASYSSDSSPENALAFYRMNMQQQGWKLPSVPQIERENVLLFHNEKSQVLVNAFREEETGNTTILTMEQRIK